MLANGDGEQYPLYSFGDAENNREGTPSTAKGTVGVELADETVAIANAKIEVLGL